MAKSLKNLHDGKGNLLRGRFLRVFRTLEPEQQRSLSILFVAGLLFWSSLASMLPTLPLYIKHAGGTDQQIGIVIGAFAIGLLLFRPWLGRLADQRDRKLVLLIGLAAAAIAPLGYSLTQSIPLLIAIRTFHGLSIAAFTTGFSALVTDLSPPQHRGEIIGYMTLVNPIGVALGPALGGYLQEWAGYTPLFLMAAGLGLVGIVCMLGLKVPPAQSSPRQQGSNDAFWQLLLSPRLRTPALVLFLVGLAFGTLAIFVPLLIQETKINLNPGLFYTAAAIASFSARLIVGPASDRLGRGRFITLSLLLYAFSMFMISTAHDASVFLLAGFLEGAGAGILLPMIIALTADRSHPHERGRVFGWTLAGFDLGIAIAGPVMGYLTASIGYRGLFGAAASLVILALVIFITLSSKNLTHSLKFALGGGKDIYALPLGGQG